MANDREKRGAARKIPWRMAGWGTAAFLLLLPWAAKAPWTQFDFLVAAGLLGSVGLGFEIIVRTSTSLACRSGAALAVVTAFLTIWVNGAVGMIGSEANRYNLVFGIVVLVALIGAILARFEARGMTRAMALTAAAQAGAGAAGLTTDPLGAMLSMGFSGFWLLAAWLFRRAASEGRVTPGVSGNVASGTE